jgi:hypothetical protein
MNSMSSTLRRTAKEAIDSGRCALEHADEWKENISKDGAESRSATTAAENLSTALGRVRSWCGETWSDPKGWPRLKKENPRLANATIELGELLRTEVQQIAFEGWKERRGPKSWAWRDRLELAIKRLAEIIEPHSKRIAIDSRRQVVTIDGSEYPVEDKGVLQAYRRIVQANGERVLGRTLGKGRIDRKLARHLPREVQETYDARGGNGGGRFLKPEFCHRKAK